MIELFVDTDKVHAIVGLLHDIIEDTYHTKETLTELGYPKEIVDAVVAITKIKKPIYEDYDIYINRVIDNPIALKVKIADMTHNMDMTRLTKITEADIKRQAKYEKWIDVLKSAV